MAMALTISGVRKGDAPQRTRLIVGSSRMKNDWLAESLQAIYLPDCVACDEGRDAVEPAGLAGQWLTFGKHAVGECDRSFRLSFDGSGSGQPTRSKRSFKGEETRRRRRDQARIVPVQSGSKCTSLAGTQLPTVRLGRRFEERGQRSKPLGNHPFAGCRHGS